MLGGVYVYHCKQWIVYRITESICCPPKNDYNVLLIMLQLKKNCTRRVEAGNNDNENNWGNENAILQRNSLKTFPGLLASI